MKSLIGLVSALILSTTSVQVESVSDEEYKDAKVLYELLSEELSDEENEILSDDKFIWGLIGSSIEEGRAGLVQYSFSRKGAYGFELPSGGTKIKTLDDISYLESWTISDKDTEEGLPKKGSLGVGCIQWSYDRRIKYCKVLRSVISNENYITDEELQRADIEMILKELRDSSVFIEAIENDLPKEPDVTDYCKSLCVHYFGIKEEDSITNRCENANELYIRYNSEKRRRRINTDIEGRCLIAVAFF